VAKGGSANGPLRTPNVPATSSGRRNERRRRLPAMDVSPLVAIVPRHWGSPRAYVPKMVRRPGSGRQASRRPISLQDNCLEARSGLAQGSREVLAVGAPGGPVEVAAPPGEVSIG